MTRAQAEAHQAKHGFAPVDPKREPGAGSACRTASARLPSRASQLAGALKHPMNKTEAEYALILETMKRRGEILRYEYEGITLRWADMKYTPDFIVLDFGIERNSGADVYPIKLIEVKGGHIWDRDIVRFKGARAYWPEFQFEMHQKKQGQWRRIH